MRDLVMILQPRVGEVSSHHRGYAPAYDELATAISDLSVHAGGGAPTNKGGKGALHEIAILLTTASVPASLVAVMRLWLSRDRRRWLEIRIERDGKAVNNLKIEGDVVSVDLLNAALRAALNAGRGNEDGEDMRKGSTE
jgi:hypothetical protein